MRLTFKSDETCLYARSSKLAATCDYLRVCPQFYLESIFFCVKLKPIFFSPLRNVPHPTIPVSAQVEHNLRLLATICESVWPRLLSTTDHR